MNNCLYRFFFPKSGYSWHYPISLLISYKSLIAYKQMAVMRQTKGDRVIKSSYYIPYTTQPFKENWIALSGLYTFLPKSPSAKNPQNSFRALISYLI